MEPNSRAAASTHRLRSLNEPLTVTVQLDAAGIPRTITLRRRRCTVAGVQETWRVDDEWWRPRAVSRLYFQVVLEDGRLLTLYRDLLEGHWWMQRY
jgi:hypothetical protein